MRCFTEICGEIRALVYDNFKSDNGENIIHTKVRIRIPVDYVKPLESVCLRGGGGGQRLISITEEIS